MLENPSPMVLIKVVKEIEPTRPIQERPLPIAIAIPMFKGYLIATTGFAYFDGDYHESTNRC